MLAGPRRKTRSCAVGEASIGGDAPPSVWLRPGNYWGLESAGDVVLLAVALAEGDSPFAGLVLDIRNSDQECSVLEAAELPPRGAAGHPPTILISDGFWAGETFLGEGGADSHVLEVGDLILHQPSPVVEGWMGWKREIAETSRALAGERRGYGVVVTPWSLDPEAGGSLPEQIAASAVAAARIVEREAGTVPLLMVEVGEGQQLRATLRLVCERLAASGIAAPLLLPRGGATPGLLDEGIGEARITDSREAPWTWE